MIVRSSELKDRVQTEMFSTTTLVVSLDLTDLSRGVDRRSPVVLGGTTCDYSERTQRRGRGGSERLDSGYVPFRRIHRRKKVSEQ